MIDFNKLLSTVDESQAFNMPDGVQIRSLAELTSRLKYMDESVFQTFVTPEKNDFANWISGCFDDTLLAQRISKLTSKNEIILELIDRIEHAKLFLEIKYGKYSVVRPHAEEIQKDEEKLVKEETSDSKDEEEKEEHESDSDDEGKDDSSEDEEKDDNDTEESDGDDTDDEEDNTNLDEDNEDTEENDDSSEDEDDDLEDDDDTDDEEDTEDDEDLDEDDDLEDDDDTDDDSKE